VCPLWETGEPLRLWATPSRALGYSGDSFLAAFDDVAALEEIQYPNMDDLQQVCKGLLNYYCRIAA